jgi:polar amino acid transport system substrate-binding protein
MLVVALAVPARAADLAEIKTRGTLRVLAVHHPAGDEFISAETAEAPGFDYEMLDGFARLQRVKLEVVDIAGWDDLIPALLKDRGDVIAGNWTLTDARRKLVACSVETFPSRTLVLTRKPHRVVESLEALRTERVGTVKGTSLAQDVETAGVPRANVDDTIVSGTLPQALKDGRVTAVVLGTEMALAAQRRDPALQIGVFVGPRRSLGYSLRLGDAELLTALNTYLEAVRHTATWSRLLVKYFGEAAPEILKKARGDEAQ